MTNLNFSELHGKRIRIAPSQRDPSRRRSNIGNIFIKNLPEFVDHSELYFTFQQFGPILSCKVVYDPMTGKSRVSSSEECLGTCLAAVGFVQCLAIGRVIPAA